MPIEPNPSDSPELIDLRKGQDDPLILYIIVRESLAMSPGKIASQAAHGVQMFTLRFRDLQFSYYTEAMLSVGTGKKLSDEDLRKVFVTEEWLATSYRKVVLRADDKEWERLKAELWCFLVRDAGLTEVESGSETVLVLWPMRKSEAPRIVRRLQVLK